MIAATAADIRDTIMEGPSGLLASSPPSFMPKWEPSKRRITWPNGVKAVCIAGSEPERARGLNVDTIWADELPAWQYPQQTWDLALMALRHGDSRAFISTTPRTEPTLMKILSQPMTVVSRESTLANARHLSPEFVEQITTAYEGTRFYRQEIDGVLIDQPEGAWFAGFDEAKAVTTAAEFAPGIPVHIGCDAGTSRTTGAVYFQAVNMSPGNVRFTVFGDYCAVDVFSAENAVAIKQRLGELAPGGMLHQLWIDQASTARTSIGPSALGEYMNVFGHRSITSIFGGRVTDGLDAIEIALAQGNLLIHPRCTHLIDAFKNYQRAHIGGRWLDVPASPQSPYEDMMDALRYGFRAVQPEARKLPPKLGQRPGNQVF